MDNLKLQTYVSELSKWNKGMNLIGKSTENNIMEVHIEDSLSLLPFLEKESLRTIVDIGSGGGLPAIPLSLAMPETRFVLTEVDSKKLAFLEFITSKLKLNSEVRDINQSYLLEQPCLITSRAFSRLKNIITWADKHAPHAAKFFLLKGRQEVIDQEAEEAGLTDMKIIDLPKGRLVILTSLQS